MQASIHVLKLLVLLALLLPRVLAADGTLTITVNMTDDEYDAAIVGMLVTFSDEAEALFATCMTDEQGSCQLSLTSMPVNDMVRGKLDFGAFGVRSLIFRWQDGDFTVNLQTDHTGQVIVPGHHAHPTLSAEFSITPITFPPARPQTTPTTIPTAEFVILDPNSFTPPATAQPIDLIIDTVTTPIPIDSTENSLSEAFADSAESNQQVRWPIILCSGLFIVLWLAVIAVVWQRSRQPEQRFHV